MRRAFVIALLGVVALGVLWVAGEMHVRNCQHAGKINCTVLPWSGDKAGSPRVDWGGGDVSGLPSNDGFPADNNGGWGN